MERGVGALSSGFIPKIEHTLFHLSTRLSTRLSRCLSYLSLYLLELE